MKFLSLDQCWQLYLYLCLKSSDGVLIHALCRVVLMSTVGHHCDMWRTVMSASRLLIGSSSSVTSSIPSNPDAIPFSRSSTYRYRYKRLWECMNFNGRWLESGICMELWWSRNHCCIPRRRYSIESLLWNRQKQIVNRPAPKVFESTADVVSACITMVSQDRGHHTSSDVPYTGLWITGAVTYGCMCVDMHIIQGYSLTRTTEVVYDIIQFKQMTL